MASLAPASPAAPPALAPTATVRLEVRLAGGRATVFEVGDGGFLVGSVPGCDLRLAGANLPPVVCLLSRHPGGAGLRKLAPVLPIAVNGRTVGSTYLRHDDRVSVGGADLRVFIALPPAPDPSPASLSPDLAAELDDRLRNLEAREKQADDAVRELETDRVIWHRRREEIEGECRHYAQTAEEVARRLRQEERDLSSLRAELESREQVWQAASEELAGQRQELQNQAEAVERERAEVQGLRRELADLRQQVVQRYQQRRDRLIGQHQAVQKAANRVRERKGDVDARESRLVHEEQALAMRLAEIEAQAEQVGRERLLLEDQHRLLASRQQELQRDLGERLNEIQTRERQLTEERTALDRSQKQHQADLVRLDRIQATLEQKQKTLEQRALEVDLGFEQLQRDLRGLDERATQNDEWQRRLAEETERLAAQKTEQDSLVTAVEARASALEGQQSMLTTLRTRLERMREELRRQEQALADQRAMQEASETDLQQRQEAARQLRADLDNDRQLFDEQRRRFNERQTMLEQAVSQLRQTQETLEREQESVRQRQTEQDATAAEQAEQAGLLVARGAQLEEVHNRLNTEQQLIRDRESTLARAEQTLSALQEQLRRRSEELAGREARIAEGEETLRQDLARFQAERQVAEQEMLQAGAQLETVQADLTQKLSTLEEQTRDVREREQTIRAEQTRLEESAQLLNTQRQALVTERIGWEVERQAAQEAANRTRAEFEGTRTESLQMSRQLVDLESRAQSALERLNRAREQLREHLGEVHAYARQSREDLEGARRHVQGEVERIRQQELALQVARDEHRLSVVAFRQQLIEWQGQVGEMKQTLEQGETHLERRQAEVEQQAQELASTEARLAEQAEQLVAQYVEVEQKRDEMDRHLGDMREWYRRKLRELAGIDRAEGAPTDPESSPSSASLAMATEPAPGPLDEADEQLGALLRSLELMDADTLSALLREAGRQRRTLRQLLLAGNYLTLYQMALIEAGNLDALAVGPVRVIDRLRSTARETVYRVFDPRRNVEAVLRHLSAEELDDAVHPDEFRQRFSAATGVHHPNVAAVLEVLEIGGRPAVLQEWVSGLPSSDWPALAGAPGIWFRLVSQAALAVQTLHEAGQCHGHLSPGSFVLTVAGVLKLLGLGEPSWLVVSAEPVEVAEVEEAEPADEGESPAADLLALGHLALGWSELTGPGRGRGKFPAELQAVMQRLQADDPEARYPSAAALLEDLEKAGGRLTGSPTAWERLLRQVAEHVEQ